MLCVIQYEFGAADGAVPPRVCAARAAPPRRAPQPRARTPSCPVVPLPPVPLAGHDRRPRRARCECARECRGASGWRSPRRARPRALPAAGRAGHASSQKPAGTAWALHPVASPLGRRCTCTGVRRRPRARPRRSSTGTAHSAEFPPKKSFRIPGARAPRASLARRATPRARAEARPAPPRAASFPDGSSDRWSRRWRRREGAVRPRTRERERGGGREAARARGRSAVASGERAQFRVAGAGARRGR